MRWPKRRSNASSARSAVFDPGADLGVSTSCRALQLNRIQATKVNRDRLGLFQTSHLDDQWTESMQAAESEQRFSLAGVRAWRRCTYSDCRAPLSASGKRWAPPTLTGLPLDMQRVAGVIDLGLWGLYGVGKLGAYIAAAGDDIAALPIADELGGTLTDRVRAYRLDVAQWAHTVEQLRAQLLPAAQIEAQLRSLTDQLWAETVSLHTLADRISAQWGAVEDARNERITMEQAGTFSHSEVMASDSQARVLSADALADITKRVGERQRDRDPGGR